MVVDVRKCEAFTFIQDGVEISESTCQGVDAQLIDKLRHALIHGRIKYCTHAWIKGL